MFLIDFVFVLIDNFSQLFKIENLVPFLAPVFSTFTTISLSIREHEVLALKVSEPGVQVPELVKTVFCVYN